MSVESLAIALHHSRAKGAAKLILIGIANHDGDGGAWPSVSTLMKYAGISDRRGAVRLIVKLEQLGEIRRLVSAGGDHSTADHLRPNLYQFKLTCPVDCDRSKNHKTKRDRSVLGAVELEGMVQAPPVVPTPPDGAQTMGGDGAGTIQTIPITINSPALETALDARGGEEDAPSGGDSESLVRPNETPAERWQRMLHQKCPYRKSGGPHVHQQDGTCAYCGIRRDQFWIGKEIHTVALEPTA